jgi:hypothetical protein
MDAYMLVWMKRRSSGRRRCAMIVRWQLYAGTSSDRDQNLSGCRAKKQ